MAAERRRGYNSFAVGGGFVVGGLLIILLAGGALAVGGLLGWLSVVAGRRRDSVDDVLADVIDAQLPQLQCAECGYAGCKPFALAVARGEAGIDLCLPGGDDVMRRIAEIVNEPLPLRKQKSPHNINLPQQKQSLQKADGDKEIPAFAGMTRSAGNAGMTESKVNHSGVHVAFIRREECVGCALCLPVCPTDAIVGAARFEHSVLEKDCTGCALCLPVCPTDAIEMRPPKRRTALNQTLAGFRDSASRQNAKLRISTTQTKTAGQQCIRCNLCAEVCPAGLSPMRLHALSQDEQWQKMTADSLSQCIHCRQCDDICPSDIPLSAEFARAKSMTAKTARAKTEAARLKTRFDMRQKRQIPPPPPVIDAAAQAAAAQARLQK